MERELRLKAFVEEYSRLVQLFDDIMTMKESMMRLETYMIIMVCQVAAAMIMSCNVIDDEVEMINDDFIEYEYDICENPPSYNADDDDDDATMKSFESFKEAFCPSDCSFLTIDRTVSEASD